LAAAVFALAAGCHQSPPDQPKNAQQQKAQGQKPSRIAVKHGLDPDVNQVNMSPRDITVEELIAMQRPKGMSNDLSSPEYQSHRAGPLETQVWRLKCTLQSIVHRRDGDYFLVVKGETGVTTVVEVPDPGFCKGSAVEDKIKSARTALDNFKPGDEPVEINKPATIEGIGFWGAMPRSGGKGAPNGARIMPATNVQLGE
jgi:hypothetical protein